MMEKEAPPLEGRLLTTLEKLLELPGADLGQSLDQACELVLTALQAEKVDVFLLEPEKQALRARGTSNTPMGRLQQQLGLDFLPVSNGGSAVRVFMTGEPYRTGHADQADEVPGVVHALGVRSTIAVLLDVAGERRGVVSVQSSRPDFFCEEDLRFLVAAARWIGSVTHRAELVEQVAKAARAQGRRKAAEELVTVLAHDLRNYLMPLTARLELVRRRAVRELRPDDVRDVERVNQSVARLGRLISDLLDIGRLDQGIFEIVPAALDLIALAQDTAEALGTPGVEIHVKGPPELVVMADPARIRQALENLVSNAVKYSPQGKAVTIAVSSETQSGQMVAHVDVCDEGSGVPPELLPTLFDRFVTGNKASGLGLGLYLARRITEAHGGTLSVMSSVVGQGATFRLSLLVAGPPNIPQEG